MSYETVRKLLIDLYDTLPGEIEYWETKELLSKPTTKSTYVVKELYERMRGKPCVRLPPAINLCKGSWLRISQDGDCYYYTSNKDGFCTCPEFTKNHGCNHLQTMTKQSMVLKGNHTAAPEIPTSLIKEAEAI